MVGSLNRHFHPFKTGVPGLTWINLHDLGIFTNGKLLELPTNPSSFQWLELEVPGAKKNISFGYGHARITTRIIRCEKDLPGSPRPTMFQWMEMVSSNNF